MDAVHVRSTRTVAAALLNKGELPTTDKVVRVLATGGRFWVCARRHHPLEPACSSRHTLPAIGSDLPFFELWPAMTVHFSQTTYLIGCLWNGV